MEQFKLYKIDYQLECWQRQKPLLQKTDEKTTGSLDLLGKTNSVKDWNCHPRDNGLKPKEMYFISKYHTMQQTRLNKVQKI